MKARANGIELEYESFGNPADPTILLIMGLGAQLTLWPLPFVEALVERGFHVVRYDNRDVSLSTKLDHARPPRIGMLVLQRLLRLRPRVPYTIGDMAADAVGLLDALGIEKAHIVGASMGGMIAQIFAARYQQRTKTLGVIFSSNNQAMLPPPGPKQLRAVTTRPKDTSRDGVIANSVRVGKIIGSPGYPVPDDQATADAIESYDRSYYPVGVARQFSAILGSGSLLRYDKQITAPTVVIHGRADKLMRPAGGRAIAKAIRRSRLVLFDGMAHDLPEPLWDDIVGELKTTFAEVP